MMKTHCDTTLWLAPDTEVEVSYTNGCAWATVGRTLTIHAVGYESGTTDLDVLEAVFRRMLDGVLAKRQARPFDEGDVGRIIWSPQATQPNK